VLVNFMWSWYLGRLEESLALRRYIAVPEANLSPCMNSKAAHGNGVKGTVKNNSTAALQQCMGELAASNASSRGSASVAVKSRRPKSLGYRAPLMQGSIQPVLHVQTCAWLHWMAKKCNYSVCNNIPPCRPARYYGLSSLRIDSVIAIHLQ
jgi:hypothetical protein